MTQPDDGATREGEELNFSHAEPRAHTSGPTCALIAAVAVKEKRGCGPVLIG